MEGGTSPSPDHPETGGETEGRAAERPAWPRAVALLAVALALSVVEWSVLVAVPLVLMVLFLPARRLSAVVAGMLAVLVAAAGTERTAMWYLGRGWAILLGGWFVALTLRWPGAHFLPRALGAVAGAAAVAGALFLVNPGDWASVDWLVGARLREGVTAGLEALRVVRGTEAVPSSLVEAAYRTAEVQGTVFPALLGLTSTAALGVAWWVYVRLAHGSDRGLGPLREFRFHDGLVWILVAGLASLVVGLGGAWSRAGTNAVVFMGALYAVRGAAVVVFFNGGVSFVGVLLLILGLLFVAPLILVGALVIGLGDTWLDLRARARAMMA